jgi:hypothetical protein
MNYVDLDEASDICQNLEISTRQGLKDTILRDKLLKKIVK